MSWYLVGVTCRCGQAHSQDTKISIQDGPTQAGTLAELYPSGEMPDTLALAALASVGDERTSYSRFLWQQQPTSSGWPAAFSYLLGPGTSFGV